MSGADSSFANSRMANGSRVPAFDVGLQGDGDSSGHSLEAYPVTTCTSEFSMSSCGSQIGVSETFLAYALGGGQIRVLDLLSGARTLLRGHSSNVCDIQFYGAELLCSASTDGSILLRQLRSTVHGAVEARTLLHLDTPPGEPIRLACAPEVFSVAAAVGSALLTVDCRSLLVESAEQLLHCSMSDLPASVSVEMLPDCRALDLSFSPQGEALALSAADGCVRVWQTGSGTALGSPVMTFAPAGGEPVTSVNWARVAATLTLVCGTDGNRILHAGHLVLEERRFTPLQRIILALDGDAHRLSFRVAQNAVNGMLHVACQQQPIVHLVQLKGSNIRPGVVTCRLEEPVLSFAVSAKEADAASPRLFCTHARAVTCYTIPGDAETPVVTAGLAGASHMDAMTAKLMNALKQEIGGIKEELAQQRALSQQAEAERQNRLVTILTDRMVSQMDHRLNALQERIAGAVAAAMQCHIAGGQSAERLLSEELKAALAKEVRTSMQTTILPRFDLACRDMFSQVNDSLKSAIVAFAAELKSTAADSASAGELAARLEQVISNAADVTASLNCDVKRGVLRLVQAASNAADEVPPVSAFSATSSATKAELVRLLHARNFEDAFTLVLSNSNVDLLSWLCAQLRPEEVFASAPPVLGQGVILSLVQQLGCDLGRDAATKAAWIREAVLSLDTTQPLLMPHIHGLMSQLHAQLEHEIAAQDGAVKSELRLCMRVVSSLMR